MRTRTAVYCRISDDRHGKRAGVERQEAECRDKAGRLNWDVLEVFVDNDKSAYSGKARPRYLQMIKQLEAGEFDSLIIWHLDRLQRSPVELEQLISLLEKKEFGIESVQAGRIDLSTATGRLNARIAIGVARYESEHKSYRIKSAAMQNAEQGKFWGRGNRSYGYESDGIGIVKKEAKYIQIIADRFLVGESFVSLAKWLNSKGELNASGKEFSSIAVKRILGSARISGRREHKGVIKSKAVWDEIITPKQSDEIRSALSSNSRKGASTARKYLLSGFVYCKQCKAKMVASPLQKGRRYLCRKNLVTGRNCGQTAIKGEELDILMSKAVLARLNNPAVIRQISGKSKSSKGKTEALASLKVVDVKKQETASMYANGDIDRKQFLLIQEMLKGQEDKAERVLTKELDQVIMGGSIKANQELSKKWDKLNLGRQRVIVQSMVVEIQIGPAKRGLNKFDASRVNPIWRF